MELVNLTFIVTDECNFNCSYCFQKKGHNAISNTIIKKAVDFFYTHLSTDDKIYIGFYGGEPLLEFKKIEYTVKKILSENLKNNNKKNIQFCMTTNGSLLTNEILNFFNNNEFQLTISYDGLIQDVSRKQHSRIKLLNVIKKIKSYQNIQLEINSVLTPKTAPLFAATLKDMLANELKEITFNFSSFENWGKADLKRLDHEFDSVSQILVDYYKKTGKIPVKNFQGTFPVSGNRTFQCSAGTSHMAIAPNGEIWGCFLFHDYFKTRQDNSQHRDFYFGSIEEFSAEHKQHFKRVLPNYKELHQDMFQVENDFCFLCKNVGTCMICPVNAAYSSGSIGSISCTHCALTKMQYMAKKKFRHSINN